MLKVLSGKLMDLNKKITQTLATNSKASKKNSPADGRHRETQSCELCSISFPSN